MVNRKKDLTGLLPLRLIGKRLQDPVRSVEGG
jgi:hypothetical protein